jgi:DNA-binding NarL/FixJ family response regulator
LLEGHRSFQVVGEACNGREVFHKAGELKPDIVVMDLSMPEINGLQATEWLRGQFPQIRVVALTAHEDAGYLSQVCKAGAAGYVLKRSAGEELVKAIEAVAAGGFYFEAGLAGQALARHMSSASGGDKTPHHELSGREGEVLRLVAWGYANKEVADELGLSVKTVETYKVRVCEKLGLRSRAQLVRYALRQGWLSEANAPRGIERR